MAAILMTGCIVLSANAAPQPKLGNIDLPAGFSPQAADFADETPDGVAMGISQLRGRRIKARNGIESIYIVRAQQGVLKGDPFMAGDVIIDVAGKPLNSDPAGHFKEMAKRVLQRVAC